MNRNTALRVEAHRDFRSKDILHLTLQPNWEWPELFRQFDALCQYHLANPSAVILDVCQGADAPGGSIFLSANMPYLDALLTLNRQRRFPVVIVGADAKARMIYDTLRMMDSHIGWRVYFTDTADEARTYLLEHCLSNLSAS